LSYLLNFIPFDEKLLNPKFGFNSDDELRNYILDIIGLCEKFTAVYIREMESGNAPV